MYARSLGHIVALFTALAVLVGAFGATPRALADGAEITYQGVLGNSGADGEALVSYSSPLPTGAGVAVDELGFLWATGGPGRINRYALDGRLVGSYALEKKGVVPKRITKAGDKIVVFAGTEIFSRSTGFETSELFVPVNVTAGGISSSSWQGKVAFWVAKPKVQGQEQEFVLSMLDAATGSTVVLSEQVPGIHNVELADDGAVIVEYRGSASKYLQDGTHVTSWSRKIPSGTGLIRSGDHYYCFTHSSTIIRLSADLTPSPGVVLGGASGSVIAKMPVDADIRQSTGLVHVRGNLYAVAGYGGAVMLLTWSDEAAQFTIQRRIGGLPSCSGLYVSPEGWVVANAGAWPWGARPDSPLDFGTPIDPDGMRSPVMVRGTVLAPSFRYNGRPNFLSFSFTRLPDLDEIKLAPFSKKMVGAAAVTLRKQQDWVLTAESDGKATAYRVSGNGTTMEASPVIMEATAPTTQLTSIASIDGTMVYAAVDGHIVEFAPGEGTDGAPGAYTEKARWNSWADAGAESLGGTVYISADRNPDRLWISDTEKNRVLCLAMPERRLVAMYKGSTVNPAGTLERPTVISGTGERVAVYDSGRQRIVKLHLASDKPLAKK
ncbi:hypothetical protein DB346_21355 [Verrucomicrobia bacterium LW23]|nr:hypothetical protein DB346_21355 [Verrucomicrobia bacterium LW23]